VSVSDKTGLVEFVKGLKQMGVEIISTGGTARLLGDNGIQVTGISDYTGFPEILDGRVKTLHPKVYGGLLALRENAAHQKEIAQHGIQPIDMVVVNLYPFEKAISRPEVDLADAVENIDIGGPTMIRAAAKNYTHVAVVVNPGRYAPVLSALKDNDRDLPGQMHYEMAVEAFEHTAHYDRAIANYLARLENNTPFPKMLAMDFDIKQSLRYGENPQQSAAFYSERGVTEPCVAASEQVAGKELSFNNILDADAALNLVKEFDQPAVVCIKHSNPCGAAIASTIKEAYAKAYDGDPVSAFGCVIGMNRPLDVHVAEEILNRRAGDSAGFFVEAIIAPGFDPDAVKMITEGPPWGVNVRLLKVGCLDAHNLQEGALDIRRVTGGLLVQTRDIAGFDKASCKVVTKRRPTASEWDDMGFGWLVCKHVKSNAIIYAKDRMLVGCGAGQMSRVDSVIIANRKAGERSKGAVMSSDAFFPMPDGIETAASAGITAVIQPGGSKKDKEAIMAADAAGMAMVFTGVRHFRH